MPAKRYFEFSEGSSNKFWEVWRDGASVFTRYGKIGATGQLTVKKLGSDAEAKTLHDKLIGEKTKKGYAEAGAKQAKADGKAKPTVAATEVITIPPGYTRLELGSKFWQIGQKNVKLVEITSGKLGTPGTTKTTKYDEGSEAENRVRIQIAAKVRGGYLYVLPGPRVTPPAASTNAALEQAIAKDPSSDDGYIVYADWLMQQNDLRGELAALNARRAKQPKDKKIANAEAKLLRENRAYFFGPWAVYLRTKHLDRGDPFTVTWRHGWIDSFRFTPQGGWWADDNGLVIPVSDAEELIRILPGVASARLLREIVIAMPSDDEPDFGPTIKAIAKLMPGLPALRRLVLGDFDYEDCELSWSQLGSLTDLWPVARKLEYLKVRAGTMDLGKIDAPELRELRIETGGFTKKHLASILDANLPKLETLNLWFGQIEYGCNVKAGDIAPLLDGKQFPKLKHLGVANSTYGNEQLPFLIKSKLLPKLETLDLSKSHITRAGIEEMVKHAAAFKHLSTLDLSECLLDKQALKLAKTLCKNVLLADQDDEEDHRPEDDDDDDRYWRYSAVGE